MAEIESSEKKAIFLEIQNLTAFRFKRGANQRTNAPWVGDSDETERSDQAMKRISIFSDGTWNSPERGSPTNVLRMARAVAPTDDSMKQICFYDWGVGTDRKTLKGGLRGAGIDKNIMDCYRFLVHNYDPGDKLYLFGFSRGAYTVRSLTGLIRNCGLLKREHAARISDAYALYRKRTKRSSPNEKEAVDFRAAFAIADITPIEFLGVWDTVGSLGIPVPFWGTLEEEKFLFHDLEPSKIVQHARHAVSIDENREDFQPSLWETEKDLDLEQVWFAGVHSDIGGGYKERGLSDIACKWIMDEASEFGLVFEDHFTDLVTPDATDRMHNEYRRIYRLRDKVVRRIEGPIHQSVVDRWKSNADDYQRKSKAMRQLLESVDGDLSKVGVAE